MATKGRRNKHRIQPPPKVPLPTPEEEKTKRRDWERNITEIVNRYRIAEKQNKAKGVMEALDMTDAYMPRRREIMLKHLDDIAERYKDVKTKWRPNWIKEEFIILCLMMSGYAELESRFHWTTAASIWILDQIANDTEKREKLYELLPRSAEDLDKLYRFCFRDSRYDTDLILSVQYLIYNRNGEPERDMSGCPRIAIPQPSKAKKEPTASERENFDAMMALIPDAAKEAAAAHLKKIYNEWLDHYFREVWAPTYLEYDGFQEQLRENVATYNKIADEIDMMLDHLENVHTTQPVVAASPLAPQRLSLEDMLSRQPNLFAKAPALDNVQVLMDRKHREIEELGQQYNEIEAKADEILNTRADYAMDFARDSDGFGIEGFDPYELCFGLLYLIEKDDEIPWLFGPCLGMMSAACKSLPWGVGRYLEENDAQWDGDEKREKTARYDVPMPDWNKRQYTAKGKPPRSMAQLVYEMTGSLIPRDTHLYDGYYRFMKKYGLRQREAAVLLTAMTTLSTCEHKIPADNLDSWWDYEGAEEELDEVEQEEDETENALRQLRDQVKQLRSSLHEAEKNARDALRDLELEKSEHETDRRELADLREAIFNRDQDEEGEQDEQEAASVKDLFPYKVGKTTVVFGGHDKWLKSIKQLLEGDIRFISKDQDAFDASVLRKADVIWIQPNCMSHKQFYKVMDHARQWKKQVRYFTNVSAVKGAEQVMENDR